VADVPTPVAADDSSVPGGTFTRVQGVKKCTSATVAEVARTYGELPYVTLAGPLSTTQTSSGFSESRLQGLSRQIDLVRTTTTRSQKGSGPVTTTVRQVPVSTRVELLACEMWYADYDAAGTVLRAGIDPRPFDACDALELFLTP
jgi:hypothetical protein